MRFPSFAALAIFLFTTHLHGAVSVAVSPRQASVTFSQKQQFKATVSGTTTTTIAWSVDGIAGGDINTVGSISSTGLYTPPKLIGGHTVKATSTVDATASGTAPVVVTNLGAVPTYHFNNSRTGLISTEIVLTLANVKS